MEARISHGSGLGRLELNEGGSFKSARGLSPRSQLLHMVDELDSGLEVLSLSTPQARQDCLSRMREMTEKAMDIAHLGNAPVTVLPQPRLSIDDRLRHQVAEASAILEGIPTLSTSEGRQCILDTYRAVIDAAVQSTTSSGVQTTGDVQQHVADILRKIDYGYPNSGNRLLSDTPEEIRSLGDSIEIRRILFDPEELDRNAKILGPVLNAFVTSYHTLSVECERIATEGNPNHARVVLDISRLEVSQWAQELGGIQGSRESQSTLKGHILDCMDAIEYAFPNAGTRTLSDFSPELRALGDSLEVRGILFGTPLDPDGSELGKAHKAVFSHFAGRRNDAPGKLVRECLGAYAWANAEFERIATEGNPLHAQQTQSNLRVQLRTIREAAEKKH